MNEKEYELKDILSDRALFNVIQYSTPKLANGKENSMFGADAVSLFGWKNDNSVNVNDVVEIFQNLADPEFVNVREDWGTDSFGEENQTADGIEKYAQGKCNSFSLKAHNNRIGNLNFPLISNHMSNGKNLTNFKMPTELSKQLSNIENTMNIEIQSVPADFSKLSFKEKNGLVGKLKHFLSPVIKVSASVFDKFRSSRKDYTAQYKIENKKTAHILLSEKFNGVVLSDAEKMVAVLNLLSQNVNQKVAQNYDVTRKDIKHHPESAKIVYASQLLTNINLALAHDLGAKNHKQIDNALRLELANVMASFKDKDPGVLAAISLNAQIATETLLKQLEINHSKIVEHKSKLGIKYVKKPNSLYDVMFGKTIDQRYYFKDNSIKFYGQSDLFEQIAPGRELDNAPVKIPNVPVQKVVPTLNVQNDDELDKKKNIDFENGIGVYNDAENFNLKEWVDYLEDKPIKGTDAKFRRGIGVDQNAILKEYVDYLQDKPIKIDKEEPSVEDTSQQTTKRYKGPYRGIGEVHRASNYKPRNLRTPKKSKSILVPDKKVISQTEPEIIKKDNKDEPKEKIIGPVPKLAEKNSDSTKKATKSNVILVGPVRETPKDKKAFDDTLEEVIKDSNKNVIDVAIKEDKKKSTKKSTRSEKYDNQFTQNLVENGIMPRGRYQWHGPSGQELLKKPRKVKKSNKEEILFDK